MTEHREYSTLAEYQAAYNETMAAVKVYEDRGNRELAHAARNLAQRYVARMYFLEKDVEGL